MASKIYQAIKPGMWLTTRRRLEKGIWPWTEGVRARLPRHYKVQYVESFMKESKPVHYIKEEGKWKLDKWGQRVRIQNIPIPAKYPAEADEGLWGGEGVVEGMRTRKDDKRKPRVPYIWRPQLAKRLFYSEILDRHMAIPVTRRTLDQIDECYGFDFYILKTHQVDLKSRLGMKLKREMLLALGKKTLYPDKQEKREEIFEKYKEFIIPIEEAEWLGLTIEEAEYKLEVLEEDERLENLKPLKHVFMEELVHEIKDGGLFPEKDQSYVATLKKRLNPFKSTEDKQS